MTMLATTKWIRVSKNQHCPGCDKPDWCLASADGTAAICARIESDKPAGNNGAGWIHQLNNSQSLTTHIENRDNVITFPLASISRRDLTYNCLLSELTLSDSHRTNLQKRGLNDTQIADLGYKTLQHDGREAIIQRLIVSIRLAGVPGFYIENGNVKLSGAPGILIPVRDSEYRIQALQVRCDNTDGGKYKWISSAGKHLGCSSKSPIHVSYPEHMQNGEVWITEGPLKADIAAIKIERCILAIAGVGNWAGIVPIINQLKPGRVIIALDMDKTINTAVKLHSDALITCLLKRGVRTFEADWNTEFKGLDDLLTEGD